MSPKGYKQDLPPVGGFDPIKFTYVGKPLFKAWKVISLFILAPLPFVAGFLGMKAYYHHLQREMGESRIALQPFLMAENSRVLMKQMHVNRAAERELMADNPQWEVGKLGKEPVFHNVRGRFIHPQFYEHYMHSAPIGLHKRVNDMIWR